MKTLIDRLEAALGDAHDPVKVALVAGDVRALIARHKALHEAAGALLDALPFDANSCVGRPHDHMVVATKLCRLASPYGGSWYACDECAANPPADLPTTEAPDRRIAAPLRALRAALKVEP